MSSFPFHEAALLRAAERLDALRRAGPLRSSLPGLRHLVREVVVVTSSSRGGSTVLAEVFRRAGGLLNFSAEINPFLLLAGLAHPESGSGSDRLDASHLALADRLEILDRQLVQDCGHPWHTLEGEAELEQFAADLAWRLTLQWPLETFTVNELRAATTATMGELVSSWGWLPGRFEDPAPFHLLLLLRLRPAHPCLDPYYYDLPAELIRRVAPELPVPSGPPSPVLIEEPPFVTVQPFLRATGDELSSRPLVIKTPSNCYRLDFLRGFFSEARFRILHLTRNAAASINGLMDGWRHRGFFSHRLPVTLEISGYSDSEGDWARHWWKFDLPPGWEALTARPLPEVCAFQWRSAHQAVLEFVERSGCDSRRLRFEDFIDPAGREAWARRLLDWLGPGAMATGPAVLTERLPVTMATEPPRPRRWQGRAELLRPVLESEAILRTMERLDYEREPASWS